MKIGDRIKSRRLEIGMTLKEVADAIGVKEATVQRYESGNIKTLKQKTIANLAEALKVSPTYLMGWDDNKIPSNATPATDVPMIPEVGNIAAGVPILAEQNIIGYLPAEGIKNPEEYFYLRVNGDSMINAGIPDGSSVLIHKQSCAENGQIVACIVNGDSATLKRFKQLGNTVLLIPENAKYQPYIVKCTDFDSGYARICGVAVRCMIINELL